MFGNQRSVEPACGEIARAEAADVSADVMTVTDAVEHSPGLAIVTQLIRELHAAGVSAEDALNEGGDRWPCPLDSLVHAIERGYTALS